MDATWEHLSDALEAVVQGHRELQTFPLLDLPSELWAHICELAVTDNKPIQITKASQAHNQAIIVQQPAITRTCRLLREECLPAFYRNNKFEARHACNVACPRKWLLSIGTMNLRTMKEILLQTMYSKGFWEERFERAGIDVDVKVVEQKTKIRGPCAQGEGCPVSQKDYKVLKVTFL